ncbi:MAG: galactose oxidase-like domain-containing protein [Granulosicoccus sp.]
MTLFQLIRFRNVCLLTIVLVAVASIGLAGNVAAHGTDPSDGHGEVAEILSEISSDSLPSDARLNSVDAPISAEMTPSIELSPPAAQIMSPVLGGSWSPLYDWPIVAIHAALLPTGKVLSWDATPDDSDDDPATNDISTTRVTLWDPVTNSHVSTNNDTGTDLFCAGSAHLWDGRILFAGGDGGRAGANAPLSHSNIYEPETNTWRRTDNMNAPRWYASVAALSNGEMLAFGGGYEEDVVAEVFQFDQTWRDLDNAVPDASGSWWLQTEEDSDAIAYDYQWVQSAPDGSVISFGPQNLVARLETEDLGTWTNGPPRDEIALRDYGSYAMFDVGKILVAGGGDSESSAVVIDTQTQQTSDSGSMTVGRRQHNLTILADGSVLVTGGNTDGTRYYSAEGATQVTELWDPATGQFRVLNPMQGDRQYHSSALLLQDGRVLSGGGGICGDCYAAGYEERNAEIFTPPYLYAGDATLASRPALIGVPEAANYGETIQLSTSSGSTIVKAHLIKLGSATHSENQDQRLVPLSFSQSGTSITFPLPSSRNSTPPGHYLLFLVDEQGVPSTGGMLKVGQPLIELDDRVVSTLEAGALDTYAINLQAGQWITEVSADAGINLYVSRGLPLSEDNLASAECEGVLPGQSAQRCSVSVSESGLWFVSITGSQRSDYVLDMSLDSAPESTPTPVDNNPPAGGSSETGRRVTTGGSVSVHWVSLLLFVLTVQILRSRSMQELKTA